ncbi:hypothetical protein SAMN05421770_105146 [Granulicella rosea]|uniref:YXWGXW repeat-containing protein n=1 Tax=Granulicella rosea TaxID=474952 RepID=A0A239KSR7_9BACT|nr:hypothetical protein [Granulicella rosea]SNT20559.1 hypothetical protein SAMN05421770_105146 [Granulicella rosea]
MHVMKALALPVLAAALFAATPAAAPAQISIGIGVGEPVCPYGYFDYAPYSCAPYGYYGPEWFNGGVFIGAGRWFHGPAGFHGHVDNRWDPHHGYHGPLPEQHAQPFSHFQPNEARGPQGVVHEDHPEHFQGGGHMEAGHAGGGRR